MGKNIAKSAKEPYEPKVIKLKLRDEKKTDIRSIDETNNKYTTSCFFGLVKKEHERNPGGYVKSYWHDNEHDKLRKVKNSQLKNTVVDPATKKFKVKASITVTYRNRKGKKRYDVGYFDSYEAAQAKYAELCKVHGLQEDKKFFD